MDKDLKKIHTIQVYTRPILSVQNIGKKINNLENSFNCSYLRILKCLEKQSLFCFVLYCEYL